MTCFSIGFSIPFLSFFFFSLSAFFHLYMYSMTMVLISFFVCLFDVFLLFFHSFFLYYLVCFLCFHILSLEIISPGKSHDIYIYNIPTNNPPKNSFSFREDSVLCLFGRRRKIFIYVFF